MQRQAPGSRRGKCLSCVSQTHVHAFRLLGDQPYCGPRCSEPGGLASAALKADEPLPLAS